jgi:hypothetical protein
MRKTTTVVVLAFTLAGVATSARAADEGGQAAACAPNQGSDRAKIEFLAGGAWNTSTSATAKLACSTARLTQVSPRNIAVDYFDGSATAGVSCTAEAWTFSGGLAGWSETKSSGGSTTGGNFFVFTVPSGVLGYIDVRCTIPSNAGTWSGIVGFNVQ